MSAGTCSHCGAVGSIHEHHPTGRHRGTPHHPELVDPICQKCHTAEHRVWQAVGIDHTAAPEPAPEVLTLRLAVWLARRTSALPVDTCRLLARVLSDVAERTGGP